MSGSEPVELSERGSRRGRSGQWSRSATTQQAVLDAARELFGEQGYEGTSINDIVRVSGVSVGSIYHQFGGKPDVFMALAKEVLSSHAAASAKATEQASAAGETRPFPLYAAGARAYLMDTWSTRDVSRIMLGDGPPGYAAVRRELEVRHTLGARGLTIGDPPLPDSSAVAVTALMHAAALQIVELDDRQTAERVADYFTGLILLLGADEP